ncbi:hypothetical protein BJ322DRAFT_1073986 [Thelephora terrestris]|uniref:Uncharacterized protein n=1 Tax=Thelephora terrestris TaxID=56493 RepID=A0A9P6HCV4_9AGAM|nr:hypothetical protein BJ322DRAFT_1073986 [Thelephora terrestris]
MHVAGITLRTATAALFLLCTLVPQCTAAPHVQSAQDVVYFKEDVEKAPLWSHPSLHFSDDDITDASVTFSKREELTERAIELPSWGSIVEAANEVVKAAGDGLSTIANELNVTGKIEELESTVQKILAASADIRGHMAELTQKGLTLENISDELKGILNDTLIYLEKTFPPPDQAPSHEERLEMVTTILDKVEQGFLDLAHGYGMSEDGLKKVREAFDLLKPHVENLVVIAGDLIEQHPRISSALVVLAAALIPESWILDVIGFGSLGPVKGSPAAWVQRLFWGAKVSKGSLFAILQKAGMKGKFIRA